MSNRDQHVKAYIAHLVGRVTRGAKLTEGELAFLRTTPL